MLKRYLLAFSLFLIHLMGGAQLSPAKVFLNLIDSAQAASQQNNWAQALPLWEKVVNENDVKPEFWYNLGLSRFNTANYRPAIQAYLKAKELGFETPAERDLDIARCYSALNKKDSTYWWLSKSITDGFADIEQVQQDSILRKYYNDDKFIRLLWLKDTKKMSRIQGWNYDIDFLEWQIRRLSPKPYLRYSPQAYKKEIALTRKKISSSDDIQMTAALVKLAAMVPDAHSRVYGFFENKDLLRFVPLFFQFFKEGLFVTDVDPHYKELLGKKIIAIDGHTIEKAMAQLTPYLNYDNSMWFKNSSLVRLMSPAFLHAIGICRSPNQMTLTLADSNSKEINSTVTVVQKSPGEILDWIVPDEYLSIYNFNNNLPLRRQNAQQSIWMKFLMVQKTLYVKFNHVYDGQNETISDFANRLTDSLDQLNIDKMIIDLRDNSGGNTYLLPPLLNAISSNRKVNRKGHLFCLIGRNTFSAAQNFTTYLEKFTNVTFIGEPTGSNPNFIGETKKFTLPYSKLKANISNLYWQSSYPTDNRIWVAPQVYLEPSYYSVINGIDEDLNTTLSL